MRSFSAACIAALFGGAAAFAPAAPVQRRTVVRATDLGGELAKFEAESGQRVFEALVDYPCDFTIKVIGKSDSTFAADMVGYIGRVTEVAPEKIGFKVRPSSAGQWEAVSIQAPLANADQLYECYAVLKNDPRVRMAL